MLAIILEFIVQGCLQPAFSFMVLPAARNPVVAANNSAGQPAGEMNTRHSGEVRQQPCVTRSVSPPIPAWVAADPDPAFPEG